MLRPDGYRERVGLCGVPASAGERGLQVEPGLLCVIDGAKGLRKAIQTVFGNRAVVQRCQWHKRENVVRYLPKAQQAYERAPYTEARTALGRLRQELRTLNLSAAHSLDERLEETLPLHRLGVFTALGISLKTTNCLESLKPNSVNGPTRWLAGAGRTRYSAGWPVRSWPSNHGCAGSKAIGICRCFSRRCAQRSRQSPYRPHGSRSPLNEGGFMARTAIVVQKPNAKAIFYAREPEEANVQRNYNCAASQFQLRMGLTPGPAK